MDTATTSHYCNKPIFQKRENSEASAYVYNKDDADNLLASLTSQKPVTFSNAEKTDVVLYQTSFQGFGAAFIAWTFFEKCAPQEKRGTVQYISYDYPGRDYEFTQSFLDDMTGKNLLVCGFHFGDETFNSLFSVANSLFFILHHKDFPMKSFIINHAHEKKISDESCITHLYRLFRQYVDPKNSDLTKNYFQDTSETQKPVEQKFLNLLQKACEVLHNETKYERYVLKATSITPGKPNIDRDAIAFYSYLKEQPRSFAVWYKFWSGNQDQISGAIIRGQFLLENNRILIKKICQNVSHTFYTIDDQIQLAVQCNTPILKRAVGSKLLIDHPHVDFALIWFYSNETHGIVQRIFIRDGKTRDDLVDKSTELPSNSMAPGCLNFPAASYPQIVEMLNTSEAISGSSLDGSKITFIRLFKTTDTEWITPELTAFLKRRFKSWTHLAIQTPSTMVDYDKETKTIIPQFDCTVIFNELTLDKEDAKKYVEQGQDTYITFTCANNPIEVLKRLTQ